MCASCVVGRVANRGFYEMVLGADFDMIECSLGDLDPQAVSSVFKAYLRERKSVFTRGICLDIEIERDTFA